MNSIERKDMIMSVSIAIFSPITIRVLGAQFTYERNNLSKSTY